MSRPMMARRIIRASLHPIPRSSGGHGCELGTRGNPGQSSEGCVGLAGQTTSDATITVASTAVVITATTIPAFIGHAPLLSRDMALAGERERGQYAVVAFPHVTESGPVGCASAHPMVLLARSRSVSAGA